MYDGFFPKFSIKDFFSKCDRIHRKQRIHTTWNVSKYGVFSGPYFPLFWMNSENYSLNFRIQSKYRKIWTRKNAVFGHFSRSVGHICWRNASWKISSFLKWEFLCKKTAHKFLVAIHFYIDFWSEILTDMPIFGPNCYYNMEIIVLLFNIITKYFVEFTIVSISLGYFSVENSKVLVESWHFFP